MSKTGRVPILTTLIFYIFSSRAKCSLIAHVYCTRTVVSYVVVGVSTYHPHDTWRNLVSLTLHFWTPCCLNDKCVWILISERVL